MSVDEAKLTAYLDGELAQAEREWIEKQLAASPKLQARLTRLRREIGQVDRALDLLAPWPADHAPARLTVKQTPSSNSPGLLVWESSPLSNEVKAIFRGFRPEWRFLIPVSLIVAAVALVVIVGIGPAMRWLTIPPQPAAQTPGPAEVTPLPAAALPSRILFTISDQFAGDKGKIYTIAPDGTGMAQVGTFQSEDEQPTLSPDGQKIASVKAGDILMMNADGSSSANITNTPDTSESSPVWSPDSWRLAFVEGHGQGLGVMDADGTRRVRLTDDKPALYSSPAWSPDGQRLAFTSNRDGNWNLYVINADGTNLLNLTRDASGETFFTWSPDGQRLAYINRDGIHIIGIDRGGRAHLTFDYLDYFDPRTLAWSPDGRWLAFLATRAANEQMSLFTLQPDGTGLTQLTAPDSWAGPWFAWSPDGQKLAFSAGTSSDRSALYVMDADGAHPTRLAGGDGQWVGLIEWRAVAPVIAAATPRPPAATPTPSPTLTSTRLPAIPPPQADTLTPVSPVVTVNSSLNVRSGPGAVYDRVGSLATGTTVAIVGRTADNTWWQIPYDGAPGGKGWISAGYGYARQTDSAPVVEAPPTPTVTPAPATAQPATPTPSTSAVQFQPKGPNGGANVGLTRFKGMITDRDGNPVDGFSVYFTCGDFHVMSFPSGPSSVAPNWAPGWYDQFITAKELECDWTMQVVRYKCSNWFDPQCTQFDVLGPPDYFHTKPGQTVVTADWWCNFDCDKGIKK